MSTESGVPDFRSRTGIWAQYDPSVVASIAGFRRDPRACWEFYGRRLELLAAVEPHEGHRALARLERSGAVEAVITQNVDGLHTRAGSVDVIELHGSLRHAVCVRCGTRYPADAVRAQLVERAVPLCSACSGQLKPGVVMFGEHLPAAELARATTLARSADLMLVVGSGLEVWPAAGLPLESGRFAIVNLGPTALDAHATLRIDEHAGVTLQALADALGCTTT